MWGLGSRFFGFEGLGIMVWGLWVASSIEDHGGIMPMIIQALHSGAVSLCGANKQDQLGVSA